MKLSEAIKQYEECMKDPGPCRVKNCPLHKEVILKMGGPSDDYGSITWKLGGCSLMGVFEDFLKNKRSGEPYDE